MIDLLGNEVRDAELIGFFPPASSEKSMKLMDDFVKEHIVKNIGNTSPTFWVYLIN